MPEGKEIEAIGDRIARLRRSKGLTQAAVAKVLHLKPYEISRVERGTRRPTLQTLERIAQGLAIEFDDLVEGTDAHDFLASKNQGVPREQHQTTLAELVKAQAELVTLQAQLRVAQQQNEERGRKHDRLLAEFEESEVANEVLSTRLAIAESRASEREGQLRESRQHVHRLEQTVQGQAAHIAGLEHVREELEYSLYHAQSQYNVLHESHRKLVRDYKRTAAHGQHLSRRLAAKEVSDVAAPLLAGLIGLGIGALASGDD